MATQQSGNAAQTLSLSPGNGHVLSAEAAASVHNESHFPLDSDGIWIPSAKDVSALDEALQTHLGKRAIEGAKLPATIVYDRQYIGVTYKGKRVIYGNFYPADQFDKQDTQFIGVEDGGNHYWAILYDPAGQQILEIAFNGEA